MTFKPKHKPEAIVYLRTDIDQYPYMVTGYRVYEENLFEYILRSGTDESIHMEIEISDEINTSLKYGGNK